MYRFIPDKIDYERANHQAVIQGADDVDGKRIGNLGELAFEQFCREYLPVEMWEWKNEEAMRRCNPESFAGHDFEVFGYEVDVKTSRDVSAFLPETLVERDSDDDIVVMVWHRDNEDSLIMLGWERVETLESKVETETQYSGESPAKLDHLAARPMNELLELGPNTAHMNQKPENPFQPGDRVVKASDDDRSVGVVIEVLPPEKNTSAFGQEMDGEAVRVAFPSSLDDGPADWREYHPAILASYCDDTDIKRWTYNHENLEFARNPYVPGDRVIKTSHDDPNTAVVVERSEGNEVTVAYLGDFEAEAVCPGTLAGHCEENGIKRYTYDCSELEFAPRE
ncbi:hypothetical protein [Natronobacterium texcoconense]|uniref:Uncharacterized protein n=1 Tax=Natronobacterium texcoconense TaxID=1095778 RepID=A0A1H1G7C9_NATTX|nr:hypothetical protein [Natronobacterium texcoconense]SDR09164.1 hypothetical protein SAMN04489842_2300 [Natronobacterium texcoconense]